MLSMKDFLISLLLLFSIPLLLAVLGSRDGSASSLPVVKEQEVLRFSGTKNKFQHHRWLSDENKDDEEEDEEDWWDTLFNGNDDEDDGEKGTEGEEDNGKDKNKNMANPSPQASRPNMDDNRYDCESIMNHLDLVPPECRQWVYDNWLISLPAPTLAPTLAPTERRTDDVIVSNPDDTFERERILVSMSVRVGVRKRLKRRQLFRLRRAVANAVSSVLHRKSPFHVPRPVWDDSIIDFFIRDDDYDNDDYEEDANPSTPPRTQATSGGRPANGEVDREPTGDNKPPKGAGSGLIDPNYINPEAYFFEIPDESNKKARGPTQRKGYIWLHHYSTDLNGDVYTNQTTGRWFYPVEVNYLVFWDVLSHLIADPQVVANVTRTCWHIGNKTLASGEMEEILVGEFKNDTLFDAIDSIWDDGEKEGWSDEEDIFDLDGQVQGDGIPTETDFTDETIPTFPTRLESSSWDRRESFGLYMMIFTLVIAGVMYVGATMNRRDDDSETAQLSPNRDMHFLTEEGVNDFLQTGWKYQKKTTGDASQLYLHVYNKSGVGYADDSSMLMGGVEQAEINADKPTADTSSNPSQNTTSTTDHETTNSTAKRDSLTQGSERKTNSSSGNSGKRSGRQTPSSTYTTSTTSQQSEGKKRKSTSKGKSRRKSHGSTSEGKGEGKISTLSMAGERLSFSGQLDSTKTSGDNKLDAAVGDRKDPARKGRRKSRTKSTSSKRSSKSKRSDRRSSG
ncbi:MAG: hypothetical protein SGBAC_010504 [Bacillariaceae sp.]